MTVALVDLATRQVINEWEEGRPVWRGRRRLTSHAEAGWSDGNFALIAIEERPISPGKEMRGTGMFAYGDPGEAIDELLAERAARKIPHGEALTVAAAAKRLGKAFDERDPRPARSGTKAAAIAAANRSKKP